MGVPLRRLSASDPRADVTQTLDAVRGRIEARFLRAGGMMASAVQTLEKLMAALGQLSGALEGEAANEAHRELHGAAGDLQALPQVQADRRAAIEALVGKSEELGVNIDRIRTALRYLRVFVLNLKITAANADDFAGFADEMMVRVMAGSEKLAAFSDQLFLLERQLRQALALVHRLEADCEKVLPRVVEDLTTCADAIRDHNRDIRRLAAQVSERTEQIHGKVGRALVALQVGDYTRQRIEHILGALALLDEASALDASARRHAENAIYHLSLAQLIDLIDELSDGARRVSENLQGLGEDAQEVLRLKAQFDRGQTAVFLRNLETSVGNAQTIAGQVHAVNANAETTGRSAAATAVALLADVDAIRSVKTDILHMALNTSLRCCHIGDAGKPMNVIAVELRTSSDELETVSDNTMRDLDMLAALAGNIAGEDAASDKTRNLAAVVDIIRAAADSAEASLAAVALESNGVVRALEALRGTVDFHTDLHALLVQARAAIEVLAGARIAGAAGDPASAVLLDRVFATYKMDRERAIHREFVTGAKSADAGDAGARDDDTLFAETLF